MSNLQKEIKSSVRFMKWKNKMKSIRFNFKILTFLCALFNISAILFVLIMHPGSHQKTGFVNITAVNKIYEEELHNKISRDNAYLSIELESKRLQVQRIHDKYKNENGNKELTNKEREIWQDFIEQQRKTNEWLELQKMKELEKLRKIYKKTLAELRVEDNYRWIVLIDEEQIACDEKESHLTEKFIQKVKENRIKNGEEVEENGEEEEQEEQEEEE